jgi:hypothetical protein
MHSISTPAPTMRASYARHLALAGLCVLLLLSTARDAAAQAVPEIALRQPALQIGVADGDSAYILFGAWQAFRTTDGRVVVVNGGTRQIRIYDRAGRHVRTLGRQGDGPGEFRMLQQVGLIAADSIAAYDIGNGRITIFAPDGNVARSTTVQPFANTVLPRGFGFTSRGSLLVRTDFDRVFRPGTRRDTVQFALVSTVDGVARDTLGRYRGEEAFVLAGGGAAFRRNVIFGRDVFASARGERLVIGENDDFSFDVYFAGGQTRRTYRQAHTPRRVTRAEVAAMNRQWLDGLSSQFRSGVEAHIGEFPHSETHPAYSALVAGVDGTTWVQHAAVPGSADRRWTVFGADGRPVRHVSATLPLEVFDAGPDYVLGRLRDEYDVERILLFTLPAG